MKKKRTEPFFCYNYHNDSVGCPKIACYRVGIWKILEVLEKTVKKIKFAFQRVFRGYDDRFLFNFDAYVIQIIIIGLREFRKNRYTLFKKLDENGKYTGEFYTDKETDIIIRKIIKCFLLSSEDFYEKYYYGSTWSNIPNNLLYNSVDYRKQFKEQDEYLKKGFELLSRYINSIYI